MKELLRQNSVQVDELVRHVEWAGITLCFALAAYNEGLISREVMDCYRDTFAKQILSYPDLYQRIVVSSGKRSPATNHYEYVSLAEEEK